jgi:protein CpxP
MKSKIISSVRLLGSSHKYSNNNFKILSKKLFVLALLIVGTTIIAQERNRKHQENKMEQFTPEQQNQLMLKKMTLELDLTEAQQKEMTVFISEKMAKKEAHKAEMKTMKEKGVKPTNDERFAMQMKMLDEQIASKKRMEKILNAKQFEKWTFLKEAHKGNRQEIHRGKPQHQGKRQG